MRTYVRMGLGPHRPRRDLERAIDRADFRMAVACAKDLAREIRKPLHLELALRLVALAATQQVDVYDAWACRWLARWLIESPASTVDRAADIAAALAELPIEPSALETIREVCGETRAGA